MQYIASEYSTSRIHRGGEGNVGRARFYTRSIRTTRNIHTNKLIYTKGLPKKNPNYPKHPSAPNGYFPRLFFKQPICIFRIYFVHGFHEPAPPPPLTRDVEFSVFTEIDFSEFRCHLRVLSVWLGPFWGTLGDF